jgi:hypothetical protein
MQNYTVQPKYSNTLLMDTTFMLGLSNKPKAYFPWWRRILSGVLFRMCLPTLDLNFGPWAKRRIPVGHIDVVVVSDATMFT